MTEEQAKKDLKMAIRFEPLIAFNNKTYEGILDFCDQLNVSLLNTRHKQLVNHIKEITESAIKENKEHLKEVN